MSDKKWELSRLSASELGALKRCAGIPFGSDMRAAQAFYRATEGSRPYQEAAWYGALCLQCLWKQDEVRTILPFEEMLRRMYSDPKATDSTKKRCTVFLDIPWSNDGFLLGKLCSLARMMRSKDSSVMPDFSALANDLCSWNSLDKYVQRRWIKKICTTQTQEEITDNKEENEDAV